MSVLLLFVHICASMMLDITIGLKGDLKRDYGMLIIIFCFDMGAGTQVVLLFANLLMIMIMTS